MKRTTRRGFTLIELMVASAILVTSLGVFLTTFNSILKSANYSQGISLASAACLNKLEEMVSCNFSEIKRMYSAGGTPGNIFSFNTSGLIGNGSINITDRRDLYGGGEYCATDNAAWPARTEFSSVVYDNKMWVISGYGAGSGLKDVWWTNDTNFTDGQTWTPATTNASWQGRGEPTTLVYDNKMWMMGGRYLGGAYLNDVWYSTNGINWTQATASANWPGRSGHASLVYDNKMWVMGGYNLTGVSGYKNDVWYSTDGVNWTRATANANWSAREGHSSVVYDNKMWIIGGGNLGGNRNDVWWTNDTNFTDGQTWYQATSSANWPGRSGHASLVYDNKMWVMGGYISTCVNDVRYSTNGANWTQATANAAWPARTEFSSVVYDNKMWVLGGIVDPSGYKNDVWYSNGYDRILEVAITVSWKQPDARIFGEDTNLDGIWNNTTEDANNNGRYDSPAQLRVLLSEKNIVELRKTFLGRRE